MKPGHSGPLSKFRAVRSDAKQVTYTMLFACKHLNRKVRRALGVAKVGNAWLPQEIVDYIVGHISDDRPTLFACTHLSRTWCIAARAHLHRTFAISDRSGFEAIDDLQNMGMIDLVRKVVATRKVNQTDFLIPAAMQHLHAFTRVQELDIRNLDVGSPLFWLNEHCDILKSTVRSLTLRYPKGSIKQLACFISMFSNLENLTVESIDIATVYDTRVPVIESSPPLTGRLTLTGIFDQEFLSALAYMPKGLKFRTVDLRFCGEMQEIVDACAGTMERLICHPSDSRDLESLDLSRCESLRHVEANFHSVVRTFPNYPFYDFISTIPSYQLETCLIVSYDNDLDGLRRTLRETSRPKSKPVMKGGKEEPKWDVKITFGLDIEKEEAECHRECIEDALDCAIGKGVFEFTKSTPTLEVYPRAWCQAA